MDARAAHREAARLAKGRKEGTFKTLINKDKGDGGREKPENTFESGKAQGRVSGPFFSGFFRKRVESGQTFGPFPGRTLAFLSGQPSLNTIQNFYIKYQFDK